MLNIKLSIIKLSDIVLRFWGISLILLKSIVIYLFLIIVFAHTTPSVDQLLQKQTTRKAVDILAIIQNQQPSWTLERCLKFDSLSSRLKEIDIYLQHQSLIFVDNDGKSNIINWNDLIDPQVKYVIHAKYVSCQKNNTFFIVHITHDISNLLALKKLIEFCNYYRLARNDSDLTIIKILQDQINSLLNKRQYSIEEIFNNKLLDDVYTDINKACTNTIELALCNNEKTLSNLKDIYNVDNQRQDKKRWIELIQLISNIFSELNSQFQTNNNIKQNNIKQNIITLIKTNYSYTIEELQKRIDNTEETEIYISILENDNIPSSISQQ